SRAPREPGPDATTGAAATALTMSAIARPMWPSQPAARSGRAPALVQAPPRLELAAHGVAERGVGEDVGRGHRHGLRGDEHALGAALAAGGGGERVLVARG